MTHRGPFQPRTFCDSVIYLCSVRIDTAARSQSHHISLHIDDMQITTIFFGHASLEDFETQPHSLGCSHVPRFPSQQLQLSPYPLP